MSTATQDRIHPTAAIGPEVDLAPDVQVGPFSIIEGPVQIGPGCIIEGHVCLSGPIEIGAGNFFGHGCVIGKAPQSRGYQGEPTRLLIGDRNIFREYVTIHRGTEAGGGLTRIGNDNMLMIGAHVGHDVRIGNVCTLVNYTLVGGHAVLMDGSNLSGHSVVQQRVRVGRLAMLGGLAGTSKDIPPFVLQQGYNCVTGLNLIGMRRAGLSHRAIDGIRHAFRVIFKEGRALATALDRIEADHGEIPEVIEFTRFIRESPIGINTARDGGRSEWKLDSSAA